MSKKIAFIFPGQGAQYVGMGKDLYENFQVVRDTFLEGDERLGFHLSKMIFEGPAEELTLTKNSQVAIYVMSLAVCRLVQEQIPEIKPYVTAGLSLGEYTALTASGRLDFAEGIDLVRARGLYMHEAGVRHPGTMAVCLGMDPEEVAEAIAPLEGVWIANLNCPKQVVISGTVEGVQRGSALLKEKGAKRVLSLEVSGAFHSGLMEEARVKLKEKIDQTSLKESDVHLVMNVPGEFVSEDEIRSFMVEQVVKPVLWEKGIRSMNEREIAIYLEMGCGKTLRNMNGKIGVQGATLSVEKLGDLETLAEGALK